VIACHAREFVQHGHAVTIWPAEAATQPSWRVLTLPFCPNWIRNILITCESHRHSNKVRSRLNLMDCWSVSWIVLLPSWPDRT